MWLYRVEKSFRSDAFWGTYGDYQLKNQPKWAKITSCKVGIVWLGISSSSDLAEIFTGYWGHMGLLLV
jgi:hypothetical protein